MNSNQGPKAQLDIRRIMILMEQAPYTVLGMLLATVTITYITYDLLPFRVWLTWTGLSISTVLVRFGVSCLFHHATRQSRLTGQQALRWENYWLLSSAFAGLIFAISAFLPYEENGLIAMMFISLVLCSLIGGSVSSSITSLRVVMVFLHITLIPIIASCFLSDVLYINYLGGFLTAFYFVFFSLTLRMHRTIVRAIADQIERQDMSLKDSLTGLWNRRKLFEIVDEIDNRRSYSLLLIDIDHFKQLNDEQGHQKGDEILILISLCIVRCCHLNDLVVRYGGEEFLVLLPGRDVEAAGSQALKIKNEIEAEGVNTVSIGVAHSDMHVDFDAVVSAADKAMYLAKKQGRNRVCVDRISSASSEAV